jgi:hypothetical protein
MFRNKPELPDLIQLWMHYKGFDRVGSPEILKRLHLAEYYPGILISIFTVFL